jgi:phosphatidylserine decarboxylase
METARLIYTFVAICLLAIGTYAFWRYVWFFRNPYRLIPRGESMVSAADGTVVYVERLEPGRNVISVKNGTEITIEDIVRDDVNLPKLLIGVFMSPFDVHYNRAPVEAEIEDICHHPAKTKNINMRSMHFRTLFNIHPLYRNSMHLVQNERTVTRMSGRFKDQPISFYVVQIAGGHVNGIDSYLPKGSRVSKGEIFGMIRIGSQVDLVLPLLPAMKIRVSPGDKVTAGETVLVD